MSWIVVTDFDGTLTDKDIGNELSKLYCPEKFHALHAQYSRNELTLREFQQKMWVDFPCSKEAFEESALRFAALRPGVNEFLELCAHKKVPVYIASCGIDTYINCTVDRFFSKFAQAAILDISCNKGHFGSTKLDVLEAPCKDVTQNEPLHKGKWAKSLGEKHQAKVMAIGNGGSDRTFLNYADKIYATEKLIGICEKAQHPYEAFDNFFDILKKWPLA
jgi:2-hydroxy-3-keto-5-methylthiopentenyl-1-phosphate phosphatase